MANPVKSNLSRVPLTDPIYDLVNHIAVHHYPDLVDCAILCVWRYNCKPNADEHIFEATTRKANAIERQAEDGYDIVITINYTLWKGSEERTCKYILDKRLASIATCKDNEEEDKVDEDGRIQYRIRKPEFDGFFDVLKRHGLADPTNHKLAATFQKIHDRGERSEFAGSDSPEPETDQPE